MKLNKVYFLLIIILNTSFANNIKWYANYNKALKIAKKQNKNIMIFLINNNSKENKKMFINTFSNPRVIGKLNKNYISIILKFNSKRSYPIEMFYTNIFPSIFIISYIDESFLIPIINAYINKDKLLRLIP